MQASYTLAYSKGNTEGGVKSDIGQDDTNVTQDFDYRELAVDSYGYLPNDRRHSLKVFGGYSFTDEFAGGQQPAGAIRPAEELSGRAVSV